MTANQINYARVREDVRANMAKEALTAESNRLTGEANMISLISAKANELNAQTRRAEASNQAYANMLREREIQQNYILEQSRISEQQRHNAVSEQQAYQSWNSTVLHQSTEEHIERERIQAERARTNVTQQGNRANVLAKLADTATRVAGVVLPMVFGV